MHPITGFGFSKYGRTGVPQGDTLSSPINRSCRDLSICFVFVRQQHACSFPFATWSLSFGRRFSPPCLFSSRLVSVRIYSSLIATFVAVAVESFDGTCHPKCRFYSRNNGTSSVRKDSILFSTKDLIFTKIEKYMYCGHDTPRLGMAS